MDLTISDWRITFFNVPLLFFLNALQVENQQIRQEVGIELYSLLCEFPTCAFSV